MLCARHQRWPAVQNANADLTLSRLIGQALPSVRQGVRGVGVERLELLPYALRRCFADSGVGGGPDSAPVRDRLAADGGSSPNTVSDSIFCEDMSGRAGSFAGGRREEGGRVPGTANPEGKPQACPHKRTQVRALSTERLIQDG